MADLTQPIDISSLNKIREREIKNILSLDKYDANMMLQHMTPMLGVTDSRSLETFVETAQSRRYDAEFKGVGKKHGTITEREVKVRPIVYEMADEPERYRDNYRIAVAGGLDAKANPFEMWLIKEGIVNASQDLYNVLWSAVYSSASGDKTISEAFDGVSKILADAITAEDIASAKNNYTPLTGAFSASNIIDRCLAAWRSTATLLQEKGAILYMSFTNGQRYDDNYKATHDAPPLLDTSGQMVLDGTQGKCSIVRLSNMPDDIIMISTKRNFRWATDKPSDMKNLKAFESGNPYLFTATMKYVFGVQFHTFSNREFYLAKVTA